MLRDTIKCTMSNAHVIVKACNTLVKEMRHFTLLTPKVIPVSGVGWVGSGFINSLLLLLQLL